MDELIQMTARLVEPAGNAAHLRLTPRSRA
jgi:hypothetical protein